MIIVGIDPGTATTGFGIIRLNQKKLTCIDYGTIETSSKLEMGERLIVINKEIDKIIKAHEPKIAAVESLYFFKNLKTAIPVSQARGVILLSFSNRKIPVKEFTPLQAKTAVAGYGRATKPQVQKMIKHILKLDEIPKPDDAADALAMAVCCAYYIDSYKFKTS